MAKCSNTIQKRGSSNPIQSKIVENNHGSSGASTGDNTIQDITCDASVAVGDWVRLSGTTIVKAQANNVTNSKVIGVCTSKADPTTCNVQVTGFTENILPGLATNTIYFLSDTTAGAITSTPPTASGAVVIQVGKPLDNDTMIINITLGLVRA